MVASNSSSAAPTDTPTFHDAPRLTPHLSPPHTTAPDHASNPDAPNPTDTPTSPDAPRPASTFHPPAPTERQRWAHALVLEIIKANLPFAALAAHLNLCFDTLRAYLRVPEVRAEIDAYDELISLRARLIGQTARPVSLRKLLDVLESPAPIPIGAADPADPYWTSQPDPEKHQRALHQHAELIRRTATTIARESRVLSPADIALRPPRDPKPPRSTRPRTNQSTTPTPTPTPAPSTSPSTPASTSTPATSPPSQPVSETTSQDAAPSDTSPPAHSQSTHVQPTHFQPASALRRASGSTRARDRPAA